MVYVSLWLRPPPPTETCLVCLLIMEWFSFVLRCCDHPLGLLFHEHVVVSMFSTARCHKESVLDDKDMHSQGVIVPAEFCYATAGGKTSGISIAHVLS